MKPHVSVAPAQERSGRPHRRPRRGLRRHQHDRVTSRRRGVRHAFGRDRGTGCGSGIGSACVAKCFAQSGAMGVGEQRVGGRNRGHFGGGMRPKILVGGDRAVERRSRCDPCLDRQGTPEARRMAIRQLHPNDLHRQGSELILDWLLTIYSGGWLRRSTPTTRRRKSDEDDPAPTTSVCLTSPGAAPWPVDAGDALGVRLRPSQRPTWRRRPRPRQSPWRCRDAVRGSPRRALRRRREGRRQRGSWANPGRAKQVRLRSRRRRREDRRHGRPGATWYERCELRREELGEAMGGRGGDAIRARSRRSIRARGGGGFDGDCDDLGDRLIGRLRRRRVRRPPLLRRLRRGHVFLDGRSIERRG